MEKKTENLKIAESLLHSFLNDQSFDRESFSNLDIKIEFLEASIRTNDIEIICAAFKFVEKSLKSEVFKRTIYSIHHLKNYYLLFHKNSNPFDYAPPLNNNSIEFYEKNLNSQPKIIQNIILEQIDIIKNNKDDDNILESDKRWQKLKDLCISKQFSQINPYELTKSKFFTPKWKTSIDPFEAVLLSTYWKCEKNIINDFLKQIDDENKKKHLALAGLLL